MRCPKCDTENLEDARFCRSCGASLASVCAQCGRELASDARFCDRCGAELAPSAAVAQRAVAAEQALKRLAPKGYAERLLATRGEVQPERRVVTILFSDVKGSTAMASDLDPEDVMEIMRGAFEVLIEPVYRYEGTLARLMGDAILAFFGAPIAHEDDPERACRAALEIIKGAQQYASRLEQERGISGFKVRVGINTGLVVVGEVGTDLRVEYTAMGDAINLAARMEGAAEPGTMLITEATHKLIAPLFETEVLGPVQVKGKAEPVSVYRVLAAKAVAGKVRGIAGLESPLVGREAEFQALREALERLRAGEGGIVTLVGEAGIGKSRLVAEIRRVGAIRCPTDGNTAPRPTDGETAHELPLPTSCLQWVEGRCLSYGASIAYLLWLDVLRALLGVTLEDAPQGVRERLRQRVQAVCPDHFDDVYPYLGRLMSLPLEDDLASTLEDMAAQDLKAHTFQAVHTLIECAANERRLVLVCEDLHWADPTSIELLQQVLALTERAPLLLLCVFRPVKDHACWRFSELAAETYAQRHTGLVLDPLSPAHSETLMANLLRIEDLPAVLRERILGRAEGNPFYVEEVIRSLIDRDAIVQDQATGRWTATREVAEIPIPDSLQGVLMARIDRLQEDTKRVLQMASVIGRIFLYRVLAAIAEEQRRLNEHLGTLQYQEMIRERARIPELEYIFKHDLTREAAYNGLLKKQRRIFHRQVAEALERLYPERVEEQLGLLAYHWEQSGNAEKAIEYLLRAGDQARLLYSHDEAINFYERALVFLREAAQHERAARTLMKLGLTYHTAFDYQQSRQAYEAGFALWQRASEAQPAVKPPPALQTLRVQYGLDPSALDPAIWRNDSVILHLFSGLVEQTPEMDIVPDVARRWEVSEGGRTYVFHLRDDVRWSDGAPVTAEDFCYAWRRVLDPAIGSPHARLLYDVRGAQAFHSGQVGWEDVGVRSLDAGTLMVELEGPRGYFLQLLVHGCTYAVPRHVVQARGAAWAEVGSIVANGPFRVEAWNQGESMILVRNPHYHGRFSGNVQRVEWYSNADPSAQLEMYESDRLDVLLLWSIPVPEIARARQRHAGELLSVPGLGTTCVAFDVTRPPFDKVRVRRALVMGMDWQTINDVILGGYAFAATGGFVPAGMPGHSPGIALPYDPERARQLLSEAGYSPGGSRCFPQVELLGLPGDERSLHEYLQTNWRENLGVDITWELLEWPEFFQRLRDDRPHMFRMGWGADYPDPDSFLRASPLRERTGWRNDGYDRLVEEARRLTDHGERMKLYWQADRILVEEAAIVPISYLRGLFLVKPWVSRFPVSAMVRDCFWKDVIIEPH
jgi:ABC-type oligopeptide transport system substrate-binding subunit/class 3 adenylate cyclase